MDALSKLSPKKVEFLIRSVAQVRKHSKVLELFSGSGLSTSVITKIVGKNVVAVDLYPTSKAQICADAKHLPFADNIFDFVIAPDSPRTAKNRFLCGPSDAGNETNLDPDQQKILFQKACQESLRVLKYSGVFAATAPLSWTAGLGLTIIQPSSKKLQFRTSDVIDPVVYVRRKKV